jgi:hypothetical protein
MGAVYLTYSAYYVSINIAGMKMFIGVSYLFIFIDIVCIELIVLSSLHSSSEKYFRY